MTATLYEYDGEAIKNVNWMYMGLMEWTISPSAASSGHSSNAFDVYSTGRVSGHGADNTFAVRPVFYLTSSVNYASGSGSATDPIVVS